MTLEPTLSAAVLASWPPLAAFLGIMLFGRRRPRLSAAVSLSAAGVSLAAALWLLWRGRQLAEPLVHSARWMSSGELRVAIGFLLDPLSVLMLAVVAAISFLVQLYSVGYMGGDKGFARYFAFMSLFLWAMTNLALAPTLLQLYVFWELVGVSSYLLIGFWYEKFSASEAGKKAFVMTRLGDVAFLLGLLLVLLHLGNLDITALARPPAPETMAPGVLTASVLLIFGGIVGKSAQFPLMTWLPDAMEGPTPVSALLHSATMVAAGVFLFARLFPFFRLSPAAMDVCLAVGTLSMLLAATMAMVSRDIKQVWAYSTISQLGLMIMGLAGGAFGAGVFHLTTHAAFKALLFLCSGVFIHHFETNDMFDIGRAGGRRLKTAAACLVVAAGALAGVPPLAGFFSKELILAALAAHPNPLWLAAALAGVFLTAYYAFRLIFAVLFPAQEGAPPAAGAHHGHAAAERWMTAPLVVLAAATVLLGFGQGRLLAFLAPAAGVRPPAAHGPGWLPALALALTAAGILLAFLEFGRRGAPRRGFAERSRSVAALFGQRWYLDHLYRRLLDHVLYGAARLCAAGDNRVIDRLIDGFGRRTVDAGWRVSATHGGMVQYRLLIMFVVAVLLAVYFFFRA